MIQLIASGSNPPSIFLGLHVFKLSNPTSLSVFPHCSYLQMSQYFLLLLHHFWPPFGAIISVEQSWRTLVKVLWMLLLPMSWHKVQICGIFDNNDAQGAWGLLASLDLNQPFLHLYRWKSLQKYRIWSVHKKRGRRIAEREEVCPKLQLLQRISAQEGRFRPIFPKEMI